MKTMWLLIVFICGTLLPLQTGFNAKLGKSIESPIYAAMICFIVAALTLVIYVPFSRETLSWAGLKSASILSMIGGGILGAIFITTTILALPRIGMALTFGLVVAGQVVISIILDHFNIMVVQQHSINLWRVIGVALIIGGVIIVQKF